MEREDKPFRILSIDGGGIRGIFPALFLAQVEKELESKGVAKIKVHEHFNLICGTSTGGILALALSFGIPAMELYELYMENAASIFGAKKWLVPSLISSAHNRSNLESLIRQKFKDINGGEDPRLQDCKTGVCIPIYDLIEGKPRILKSCYHERFIHDYHIPAYQAALATSAAPTYFDPYSDDYTDLHGVKKHFGNKVDGGVVANNPTLIGIIEAQKAFGQNLSNLKVLSIGTGQKAFQEGRPVKNWGIRYWMQKDGRKRLVELFMQGQSQQVENIVSLMHKGIDGAEPENFVYDRIDTELNEDTHLELDEHDAGKLSKFSERATAAYQKHGNRILENYFLQ